MLTFTRTFLVLIVLAAAPQIATADKKSLEVTPLGISCSHYVLDSAFFESDVFGAPQMEYGVDCELRIFVTVGDSPAIGLVPGSVRVNHFQSMLCDVSDGSPIGATVAGNGVYIVDLPCEPEDMSLIISDMSKATKTDTVITWAREYDRYTRAAMVTQNQNVYEELTHIRSLAETILGETLTIGATTTATNAVLSSVQGVTNNIQGATNSIQNTVDAILSRVNDILDALP